MRCPFATWQGSPNNYSGGMDVQPMGVVLHIEEGTEAGTVATFHNPGAQASSHFGIAKDGHIDQFVDTHDAAWAEVEGNRHWISIEHEGHAGDVLTPEQLDADAHIIAWLKQLGLNFPLVITDNTGAPGIGWHGMGGGAWGGHTGCPGDAIKNQRGELIAKVDGLLHTPGPAPLIYPPWPGRFLDTPPDTIGNDVRMWQQRMQERRWRISVDGDYGAQSKKVCLAFQKEKNLTPDGIVGPQTWAAAWTAPVT